MENLIYIFAFIVVLAIIKSALFKNTKIEKKSKSPIIYNYGRKDYIMTKAEHDFFLRLNLTFQEQYHIFPQVHLSSLLDERKIKGQNWKAAFKHINGKSVDFVVCDKQYAKPLVAIELDDWSHNAESRQKRDEEVERIFMAAEIPLVRFSDIRSLDNTDIETKIKKAISTTR